jgi:hypothetical protein
LRDKRILSVPVGILRQITVQAHASATGTAKTSYLYGRDQKEAPIREGWNKAHNPPPTTDEPPLLMQLRSIQAAGG